LPSSSAGTVLSSDEVKCPICGLLMAQSRVNSHLDDCLSFNEFS
jgi:hypothetical protein